MRRPQWIPARADGAGIALALVLGVATLTLGRLLPPSPLLSDVLLALLAGALVLNTPLRRAIGLALPGDEREPDRYAAGLRFTGKWVLRAGIIAMGLKVQTRLFGRVELALIGGVAAAALPTAFFVAHAIAVRLGVRRPMADLLAAGTMICGASAVNAVAPVAGARREEQGVAIGVVFLFSVVALVLFHPIAVAVGVPQSLAGLWSGLAVNDLASAIAVGNQMGGAGGVMATAAKSARVILLAPTLVAFALARRSGARVKLGKQIGETLPRFVLGYLALAALRTVGDRLWSEGHAWSALLDGGRLFVDLCMTTVAAGIGLHLGARRLLASGGRALLVGGGASVTMAGLTLAMVVAAARGAYAAAALVGAAALLGSYLAYRASSRSEAEARRLRDRLDHGAPLSLGESTRLLDALERATDGNGRPTLDPELLRRLLGQLHPTIGELIPARDSPLAHGEGCRWVTYWEGASGWALVAVCREPGSSTPIHAHPHALLGKTIEGVLEELRFDELPGGELSLRARAVLGHNQLVETEGLATLHVVRVVGDAAAIDLQLRGPEVGRPGRVFTVDGATDFGALAVGARLRAVEVNDVRPGHGGEGAGVGRLPPKN